MRGRKRKTITKTDEKLPVKESKNSDRQNEAKQDKIVPVFTSSNKRRKVCNYISTTKSSCTEARTTKDTESKTKEKSESIKIGDGGISEEATIVEVKKQKESNQIQEEVSPDTQSDVKPQKNINETKLDSEPAIQDKNTGEIETLDSTRRGNQEILRESFPEFAKSAVLILKKVSESPDEQNTKMQEMNIEVNNPEDVPVSSKRKLEINLSRETSDEGLNSQEPEIIQLKETSHEELKSQEQGMLMEHNLGTTLQDETSMVHETFVKSMDNMSEKKEGKFEILDIIEYDEKEDKTMDGAEIPDIIEVGNMRKRPEGDSEETVIKSNSDSVNDLERHTSLDNVLQTPATSFEKMTGKYIAEKATKRSVRIEIEKDEFTGISFSKPSYDCKEIPESILLDNGTQEVDEHINLSSVAKAKHGGSEDLSEMVHERETNTTDPLEDSSVVKADHRDTEDSPETFHIKETNPKVQEGSGSVRNSKDLKVKSVSEMMKVLEEGHLEAKIKYNKLKLKVANKKQIIEEADDSSKPCVLDTGVREGYNLIDIQESSSPSKADFESKDNDREASGGVSSQEEIKSSELMTEHPNKADSKTVNNIGSFTVFKEPNTHENLREFPNKRFGDKEEELSMELEMSASSGYIYFETDVTGISLEKKETMKERSQSHLVKTTKETDQRTSSVGVIGDILNQPLETDKELEKPLCSCDTTDEALVRDAPTELEKLISEETTGEDLVGNAPKEIQKILIIPGADIEVNSPKEVEKLLSPGTTTGSATELDKPLFIDTSAESNESLPRKSDNSIITGEILAEQAFNITKRDTSTELKDKSVDKAITTGISVEQAHTKADKDASIELEISTFKGSSVELHQNIVDEDVLLAPTQCFAITLSQDSQTSIGLSPLILDKNNVNRATENSYDKSTSISLGNVLDGQEHYASEAQILLKIQERDKIENALHSNDIGKSVDISKEEENVVFFFGNNQASTEKSEKLNKNDSINYQSPVQNKDKSTSTDNIPCCHNRIDRDASPIDESGTPASFRTSIMSVASKHKDVASQPGPQMERVESSQPFLNDTLKETVGYGQHDPDPPENNIITTQPQQSKARISPSSIPVDKTGSTPANAANSVASNAFTTNTNESLDLFMGDDFDISDSQLCAKDLCAPILSWNPLAQDRNLYQQHIKKESEKRTKGHELVEDFIKDVSELNNMMLRTKNEIEAMRRRKHHHWTT